MYHHWKVYPPKRFLSRTYQNDKAGRTFWTSLAHDGPLYAGLLGNVAVLYSLGWLSGMHAVAAVLTLAAVGDFSNWLHHSFHVAGHFLENFLWFHDLRALHYTHHQGTTKVNYGFLDFAADHAGDTAKAGDYALSNNGRSTQQPAPLPAWSTASLWSRDLWFSHAARAIEALVVIFGKLHHPDGNFDLARPGSTALGFWDFWLPLT